MDELDEVGKGKLSVDKMGLDDVGVDEVGIWMKWD